MTDPGSLAGQTVGRYQVLEHLGQGGMAEVYRAYQPSLDRYVALKIMHAFLAREEGFIGRFEREAKNVAALHHPNIIQVHDFDVHNGMPYMVMEFIEGGTLKTHLENLDRLGQRLPLGEAVRIVREVGQALAYAHERSMIHRDVKPANVLLDKGSRIILTDFGIAKILTGPSFTATGVSIGTPAYMAPEQGLGERGDHRSDLYALGVMLYQLTTGRLPFDADTPLAIMLKHVNAPLPPPRSIRPDLPTQLERIILKSMAKRPEDRYQSAGEMLAELHAFAGSLPTGAQTAVPPAPTLSSAGPTLVVPAAAPGRGPDRRVWYYTAAGLGAAVILCLAVGGGLLALSGRLGFLNRPAASATAPAASAIPLAFTSTAPAATEPAATEPPVSTEAELPLTCTDALGCVAIAPDEPIHLAYILSLEGSAGAYGQDALRAVELALDDRGGELLGHALQLTGVSSGCTTESGQAAAEQLAGDPTIVAVIGPSCSSEARSAAPILSDAGLSLVSSSTTSPDLTDPAQHAAGFLRTSYTDLAQGTTAADYAFDVLGVRQAATIHDESLYSQNLAQAFADRFEALGGTLVAREAVVDDGSDAGTALKNAAAANAELLFFPVFLNAGRAIVVQARAVPGLEDAVLLSADGLFVADLLDAVGDAAVGLKLSSPDFLSFGPVYSDFVDRYAARYGEAPLSAFPGHAYDAANLILAAVESVAQQGADGSMLVGRQALRDALYATHEFEGVTGSLTCTADGDCGNSAIAVYELVDAFNWAPGAAPTSNPRLAWRPGSPPEAILAGQVCLVVDTNGLSDNFNASAQAGVLEAQRTFGWATTTLESQETADYAAHIETFMGSGCTLIVAVGTDLAGAIEPAAQANPEQRFQIIDQDLDPTQDNVWTDTYRSDQAAFLAGYLAAAVSTSGKVGTYGGYNIPQVVAFMDGFALGVAYYNQEHGASVEVLGWDPANREGGLFVESFSDQDVGQAMAADLLAQGADVIFPVAGVAGYGGAAAVSEHGAAYVIGVDQDWAETVPDYASIVLTSVLKRTDLSVLNAVAALTTGEFTGGGHESTLDNGGVGLAPFHELDQFVNDDLKAELEALRSKIIEGEIQTTP